MKPNLRPSDWYRENIEPGIRRHVKLLRDGGFNTVSSCAHRMDVMLDVSPEGEIQRLHDLLVRSGFREFTIYLRHELRHGITFNNVCVHFGEEQKELRTLAWWVKKEAE